MFLQAASLAALGPWGCQGVAGGQLFSAPPLAVELVKTASL